MVSNDNSRNSGSEDDIMMTSYNDDVIIRRNSLESDTQCPHCAFRCTSSSIMTQHSWEMHPLLMRRKKHLITSPVTSSKPGEITPTHLTPQVMQFANGDMRKPSSTYQPTPVHETALEMKNCSLSAKETPTSSEKNVTHLGQFEAAKDYNMSSHAARSLSMLSDAAAILDAAPQPAETAPQRHVAVVKPIPIEAQRQDATANCIGIQQMPQMLPQYINKDQFVYAPIYNAYIPSLNQYVSIPIPVATGIYPSTLPAPNLLNASIENAMKNYVTTQQNTQVIPNATQSQLNPLPQLTQQPLPTQQSTPSMAPPKPLQSTTMQRQNMPFRNGSADAPSNEIRTLLQNAPTVPRMDTLPQGQSKINSYIKPEMETGAVPVTPPMFKGASLGKERQKALEEALLSTDCCDINDSSTTMPFKCPDGVWRMVKFKCIRGLWLVQIPGSPTPTVYVPCDNGKILKQANIAPKLKPGHKRKLSDPTGINHGQDVKRLCASAPISGAAPQFKAPNSPPMLRTRSHPSLPEPDQLFTNKEGKQVNISVIKRDPAPSTSGSLIKTLLLRKPSVTSPTIPMTSSLGNTSHHGRMQCKSSPTHQIQTPFVRPAPLNANSMVY